MIINVICGEYESTLLVLAIARMTMNIPIELFNICEQDLERLPASSIETLGKFPNISIFDTTLRLEKRRFFAQNDRSELRSPRYQYNLYQRLGRKHCALCDCDISEIIQGAHIWNVSDIISTVSLSEDEKFENAVSGDNGLWLCQNHHKLLDSNIISLNSNGEVMVDEKVNETDERYIAEITKTPTLQPAVMSRGFKWFLARRNKKLNMSSYKRLY